MISEMVDGLFSRWGDGGGHMDYTREQSWKLLGISIGLCSLFNENLDAEVHWMQTIHPSLGCRPIVAVLRGDVDKVLELVNKERGL